MAEYAVFWGNFGADGFDFFDVFFYKNELTKRVFMPIFRPKKVPIKTIDLHGLRHKQALEKVRKTLVEASADGSFCVTIITGNSTVLQQRIFDEILEESPYNYYIPSWNLGQIVVDYVCL